MIYTCPAGDDHHASPTTVYRWHRLSNRSFEGAVAAMARKAQAHDDYLAAIEKLTSSKEHMTIMVGGLGTEFALGYRQALHALNLAVLDTLNERTQQLQEDEL